MPNRSRVAGAPFPPERSLHPARPGTGLSAEHNVACSAESYSTRILGRSPSEDERARAALARMMALGFVGAACVGASTMGGTTAGVADTGTVRPANRCLRSAASARRRMGRARRATRRSAAYSERWRTSLYVRRASPSILIFFTGHLRAGTTTFVEAGQARERYGLAPAHDGTKLGSKYCIDVGAFLLWGRSPASKGLIQRTLDRRFLGLLSAFMFRRGCCYERARPGTVVIAVCCGDMGRPGSRLIYACSIHSCHAFSRRSVRHSVLVSVSIRGCLRPAGIGDRREFLGSTMRRRWRERC